MRLKRLKLLSDFRSLPAGFDMEFRQKEGAPKIIEPLCLVGLNGSGKSNMLQLLTEIFYYMETYCLASKEEKAAMKTAFGFIIEYWLSERQIKDTRLDSILDDLRGESIVGYVSFDKQPKALPEFYVVPLFFRKPTDFGSAVRFPDEVLYPKEEYTLDYKKVMPGNVIGYSSGMNEQVSNAFIKIDFHYFKSFQQNIDRKEYGIIDLNRLFFMDYDSNKMVVLCNYLFRNQNTENDSKLRILNDELGIKELESFKITMRFADLMHHEIELTSQLYLITEKLKKCATALQDNNEVLAPGEKDKRVLRMDFLVTDATRKAFQYHFKSAQSLYRDLYLLRLLNIHLFPPEIRDEVRKAGPDDNLSSILPKPAQAQLVFSIDDIALVKTNAARPIFYRQLSDGEHQLLHVLGAVMMMVWPGTLFIMDEPETHFNPSWRSKFVSLLNKIAKGEEVGREQEIVLTSHSPFILSDCMPDNVLFFDRDKKSGKIEAKSASQLGFNTYGSSVDYILKSFFQTELVSNKSLTELKDIIATGTIDELRKAVEDFGESSEKQFLFKKIYEKTEGKNDNQA